MKICVDLTSLDDNFSGIERFALSITKELIKNKDCQWILLFKNSVYKEFNEKNSNVKKVIIKGKNKLIFNQVLLPLRLLGIRADCYFFPAFPAPFFFFKKNTYNTIHDLSCWDCPQSNKKYMILYFKVMYWKASLNNKKIITVSQFSKDRICKILHVDPKNITVIYNGLSKQFNNEEVADIEKRKVQEKYNLPHNFVLCLSTLEPRKNLKLLLDAYEVLYSQGYIREIVLAGRKGWKMENFLKNYTQSFLSHVHFTGFVDDKDLPIVYKLADLFVFPSLYEGFGIPPLEALACGTPVISSDAASMPEVLGNDVEYFKSEDLMSLQSTIKSMDKKRHNISSKITEKYNWEVQANILIKKICS